MLQIIKRPVITEKAMKLASARQYVFAVDPKANKIEIKKAVESLYGVKVENVNTMIYRGKVKSRYTKAGFITGKTSAFKKAIVTLAAGETIDFYSNI